MLIIRGGEQQPTTWLSWIPLLLAPLMTKLEELYLWDDILSGSHPTFPMALTSFKSIRKLSLRFTSFPTLGHWARLIRAFSNLDHLVSQFNSWKLKPPILPLSNNPSQKSRLTHLDIGDLGPQRGGDSNIKGFIKLIGSQAHDLDMLRTLSLQPKSNELIPNILLHCGSHIRSLFLTIFDDSGLSALEYRNPIHLKLIHVEMWATDFPSSY